MDVKDYYNSSIIRRRLELFFEGCGWFLTAGSQYSLDSNWGKAPPVKVFKIDEFSSQLGQGPDIFRPLTSQDGVLGVFDIEYYNWDKKVLFLPSDDGKEFGVHHQIFAEHLEPIYRYLSKAFDEECIADITWSGYHFLTEISRQGEVYQRLLELGAERREDGTPRCLERTLVNQYQSCNPDDLKHNVPTSIEDGIVYEQFGRVLEYLSHQVIEHLQPEMKLPITISDTTEEGLSLDISQYADPVYMRIIRSVFSTWDKHNCVPSLNRMIQKPSFLDMVRKYGTFESDDLEHLLSLSQDYPKAIDYFSQFSGIIPRAGNRALNLVNAYAKSELRKFHQEFDHVEHDSDDENYKMAKFDSSLDLRARELMEYPNPLLLQPHQISWLVGHLLDKGWHPKHIGGMLAGRYQAEGKDWNKEYWQKYNPRTRANFWTRVYSGLKTFQRL